MLVLVGLVQFDIAILQKSLKIVNDFFWNRDELQKYRGLPIVCAELIL